MRIDGDATEGEEEKGEPDIATARTVQSELLVDENTPLGNRVKAAKMGKRKMKALKINVGVPLFATLKAKMKFKNLLKKKQKVGIAVGDADAPEMSPVEEEVHCSTVHSTFE